MLTVFVSCESDRARLKGDGLRPAPPVGEATVSVRCPDGTVKRIAIKQEDIGEIDRVAIACSTGINTDELVVSIIQTIFYGPSITPLAACEEVQACINYGVTGVSEEDLEQVRGVWTAPSGATVTPLAPTVVLEEDTGQQLVIGGAAIFNQCSVVSIARNRPRLGTVPIVFQIGLPDGNDGLALSPARTGLSVDMSCLVSTAGVAPAPVIRPGNFHEIHVSVAGVPPAFDPAEPDLNNQDVNFLSRNGAFRLRANIGVETPDGFVSGPTPLTPILRNSPNGNSNGIITGDVCVPFDLPAKGNSYFVSADVRLNHDNDSKTAPISVAYGSPESRRLAIDGPPDLSETPCIAIDGPLALPVGPVRVGQVIPVSVQVKSMGTRRRLLAFLVDAEKQGIVSVASVDARDAVFFDADAESVFEFDLIVDTASDSTEYYLMVELETVQGGDSCTAARDVVCPNNATAGDKCLTQHNVASGSCLQ